MTFDHITADQRSVARPQSAGNVRIELDVRYVARVGDFERLALVSGQSDPCTAAATGRAFGDVHRAMLCQVAVAVSAGHTGYPERDKD